MTQQSRLDFVHEDITLQAPINWCNGHSPRWPGALNYSPVLSSLSIAINQTVSDTCRPSVTGRRPSRRAELRREMGRSLSAPRPPSVLMTLIDPCTATDNVRISAYLVGSGGRPVARPVRCVAVPPDAGAMWQCHLWLWQPPDGRNAAHT